MGSDCCSFRTIATFSVLAVICLGISNAIYFATVEERCPRVNGEECPKDVAFCRDDDHPCFCPTVDTVIYSSEYICRKEKHEMDIAPTVFVFIFSTLFFVFLITSIISCCRRCWTREEMIIVQAQPVTVGYPAGNYHNNL